MSFSDPRFLLRQLGIQPKKSLGQNFLVDQAAARRIVAAADLSSAETVLEIGPGLGALTRLLAQAAARVVAVELDQRLIPVLEHELSDLSNVRLIHGDILELELASLLRPAYKVVANIPYYITSAVLRRLLEAAVQPALMVLTVQEEVARRIVAAPGDMSLLAVSVQFYGRPEMVARLKAGAFYPRPQVDSAVVRIHIHPQEQTLCAGVDADLFFQVVKAGFNQRRKQLRNALSAGLGRPREIVEAALARAGVDAQRRAETLAVREWVALVEALAAQDKQDD
jgi:16S rRNA (adenine1518-N6/adenine1519-N6)-dimethyltransferase